MEQVGAAVAIFLALVLVSAAAHKLYARERLVFATSRLLQINAGLALPAMLGAAALEAAAALALVMPQTRTTGALLAVLLWGVYFAALTAAARRGEALLDCGCSFSAHAQGIDRFVLLRPLALGGLALVVATLPEGLDPVAPFAALAFFTAYVAAGELAGVWRTAQ
jgi:hypothetical protein